MGQQRKDGDAIRGRFDLGILDEGTTRTGKSSHKRPQGEAKKIEKGKAHTRKERNWSEIKKRDEALSQNGTTGKQKEKKAGGFGR